MKEIRITLEDDEYNNLVIAKDKMNLTWKQMLMRSLISKKRKDRDVGVSNG